MTKQIVHLTHSKSEYISNVVRALFYSDVLSIHNVPLLAQIFFDVEYIHELICKLQKFE